MGRYDDSENGLLESLLRSADIGYLTAISKGLIPGVISNEKFGMVIQDNDSEGA